MEEKTEGKWDTVARWRVTHTKDNDGEWMVFIRFETLKNRTFTVAGGPWTTLKDAEEWSREMLTLRGCQILFDEEA